MIADTRRSKKEARLLLKRANITDPSVPVKRLATIFGCVVKTADLDDELSGMAFIKDGKRAIVVNAWHHPNRQRFTIAHELGHHVLHQDFLKEGIHVDKAILRRGPLSSAGMDYREVEANAFAAEILMPRDFVKKIVPADFDLQDETALIKYAKQFGVSAAALGYRILNIRN